MIPRTFPSTINNTTGKRQMVVFFITSIANKEAWKDYIPVNFVDDATPTEASYNNDGYIAVQALVSSSGKQEWKDYIPCYYDATATGAWQVSSVGFIPIGESGLGGDAIAAVTWDSSADTYVTTSSGPTYIHTEMKRCLLLDNGTVNYYLDPTDSTKKADGTNSVLDGADGQVMVEIRKFYTKREVDGDETTWYVSSFPLPGFTVHPAFIKDGVEVDKRYYSAYDACYLDATDSTYKSGLNLDNLSGSLDLAADKLSSVSGVYPIVGVLRSDCRSLAANRGTGWRQLDFTLWSAVQLLYLTEYGTFNSQSAIGLGNTRSTTWPASSSTQTDSRANIAGLSNGNGNATANDSDGTINTNDNGDFMSYRGIENFFGNVWNWADGINVNVTANGNVHVTNTRADFADNTSTNMTLVTSSLPTASGFIRNVLGIDNYFLSSSNSGGSSTTYITDQHFANASSNRVVIVGGGANSGASAGAFYLESNVGSAARYRGGGARLAF